MPTLESLIKSTPPIAFPKMETEPEENFYGKQTPCLGIKLIPTIVHKSTPIRSFRRPPTPVRIAQPENDNQFSFAKEKKISRVNISNKFKTKQKKLKAALKNSDTSSELSTYSYEQVKMKIPMKKIVKK